MFWETPPRNRRRKKKGARSRDTILRARTGRPQRGGRLRALLALLVLAAVPVAAVVLLGMGVRGLLHASFANNALFALQTYDLSSDGRLPPGLIREYGALPETGNLFSLDLEAIRDRLERVPRVRQASVTRRLPGTLVVRVTERVPLAQIRIPDRTLLMAVDADGHILGPGSTAPHLPVIDGLRQPGLAPGGVLAEESAWPALRVLELCDQTPLGQRLNIRRISVQDTDRMEIFLAGGERIWMPRRDIENKLREAISILGTIEDLRMASDRSQVVIDMTTEERFPVRGLAARTP